MLTQVFALIGTQIGFTPIRSRNIFDAFKQGRTRDVDLVENGIFQIGCTYICVRMYVERVMERVNMYLWRERGGME